MKKILVIILLIMMMPLVLYGCPRVLQFSRVVHESLLRQQVFRFVMENEAELTAIAKGQIAGTNQDKNFGKAEIEGVWDGEQTIVQFYWGGMGIAPSSKEFGFYYVPDDEPVKFHNGKYGGIIHPEENGEWRFSDDGGNSGTMIRVLPHWFYYDILY